MADRFDTIPQSHVDILESKCFAHVATIRPDGRISNHPVSILWDGEHVRFSTTKARRKYRNLLADDRITLSIPDPTNIWRYLEIRGRAVVKVVVQVARLCGCLSGGLIGCLSGQT